LNDNIINAKALFKLTEHLPTVNDALDLYIHLERFVNEGSPSGFHVRIPEPYTPLGSSESFSLPIFTCERFRVIQVGNLPGGWASKFATSNKLPMPIHPLFVDQLLSEHPDLSLNPDIVINVQPTSSGRTVIRKEDFNDTHFIKLHYPEIIGRFSRDLSLHKWLAAIENSRELKSIVNKFPQQVAFLDEFGGIFLEGGNGYRGFGVIFRDSQPSPKIAGLKILLPAFSLFSRQGLGSQGTPLLAYLLSGTAQPLELFFNGFIDTVLTGYFYLSTKWGLIPECNAQNVLYEIDIESGQTRAIFRDVGDMFKDITIRKSLGLHTLFCSYKTIDRSRDADFYMRRSFAFDFKLGEYLILPLLTTFANIFKYDLDKLIKMVRNSVEQLLSGQEYFGAPNVWYAYPRQKIVSRNTYESRSNPLFR